MVRIISQKKPANGHGVDLQAAARTALSGGVERLMQQTLPSVWSPNGRGWQEHWPDAPRAGFYASCDGLIALAGAHAFVPMDFESVADQVLAHHLAPFVTPDAPAPDEKAQQERAIVLTTTMKLAKYLQAYAAAGCPPSQTRRAKQVASTLLKEARRLKTGWSYALGDPEPAVVPTTEALVGLSAAGLSDATITSVACTAIATIDWRRRLQQSWTIRDLVMWVVAICDLDLVPSHISRAEMASCITFLIASDEAFQHAHWFHRFVNHRADANDYYSANVTLLLTDAMLKLIATGVLNKMYIRLVEPVIAQIVAGMAHDRVFTTTDKVYFWENAEALLLLTRYLTTLETMTMPITPGMFVAPRYFTTTRFAYDKKLAAILMPFGQDWASDVHTAFVDTIKAAKFRPWRADQEHTDDVIIQTIWRRINEARLVVADCTDRNPNVFYELGIAHTIGKPVFICAQNRTDIPFDVASIRSTVYKVTPTGIGALKSEFARFIEEVKKS